MDWNCGGIENFCIREIWQIHDNRREKNQRITVITAIDARNLSPGNNMAIWSGRGIVEIKREREHNAGTFFRWDQKLYRFS
jgi:hypothetical protein